MKSIFQNYKNYSKLQAYTILKKLHFYKCLRIHNNGIDVAYLTMLFHLQNLFNME